MSGRKGWSVMAVLAALAMLALALAGGCGKKPKVETEAAAPPPVTETVPETPPPAPAPAPTPAPAPAPDYAAMDPGQYGIQPVFFAYDKFDLSEQAMATLESNARIMNEHPTVSYLVEGHCDERGTVEYNLALGEKRAKAARDYLVSLGVAAARLRVTSYGEEKPFATGHDESAWSQNRRAHFARP